MGRRPRQQSARIRTLEIARRRKEKKQADFEGVSTEISKITQLSYEKQNQGHTQQTAVVSIQRLKYKSVP